MKTRNISMKEMLAAGQSRKQKEYWLNKLAGRQGKSTFPYDNEPIVVNHQTTNTPGEKKSARVTTRFPPQLFTDMMRVSKGTGPKLYMILTAVLMLLLRKYSGNDDVTVGTPISKQEVKGRFINTILVLRTVMPGQMTFRELLKQVRQTILEATENQNYPIETLKYHLEINKPADEEGNRLFDTGVLLENIHEKDYIQDADIDVLYLFQRTEEYIEVQVEYNAILYRRETIERMINNYKTAAQNSLNHVDIPLDRINIITREEKEQLINGFNKTTGEYPHDKTIDGIYAEQVQKNPDKIVAVQIDPGQFITHREMNARSSRLASRLREAGVQPDSIVGIMVSPTLQRVIGMMAIIKAGGAYLPIDRENPGERIQYMLQDSSVNVLLQEKKDHRQGNQWTATEPNKTVIEVDKEDIYKGKANNKGKNIKPGNLAYVMYTSGTTGKPKGVLVEHRSVVNLVHWFAGTYHLQDSTHILGMTNYTFDPSVEDIFGALLAGAVLYIIGRDMMTTKEEIRCSIENHQINIINYIPMQLDHILSQHPKLESINVVISGGERLEEAIKQRIIARGYTLYNNYGPTEITVDALSARCNQGRVTIGKPIANMKCYVLDSSNHLLPLGIAGELWVGGTGIARGYLNQPGLTHKRYAGNPYAPGERIYRTGDQARWLWDGNIQYLGRKDRQVKIRGHRIQLEEIESQLLNYESIKNVTVIVKEREEGNPGIENKERYLAAYFEAGKPMRVSKLWEYLSKKLPAYMIPTYFFQMERIPLKTNGKVDIQALPEPGLEAPHHDEAPQDESECRLALIWSEILSIKENSISREANFFEKGGHSLKATVLAARIHKAFNVKVPLAQIFQTPTIKEMTQYIKKAGKDRYKAIEPVEKKDYYPLSSTQKRLYMLYQLGPGQTVYNMPQVIEVPGTYQKNNIDRALKKLIERHESLRTSFHTSGEEPVQRIHGEVEFEQEHFETLPVEEAGEPAKSMIKNFVRPFDLTQPPLLRVGLQETGPGQGLIAVDMHHIISDGVSHEILARDFMTLIKENELPLLRIHYKDYVEWQNKEKQKEKIKKQEAYWIKQFEGEIPLLNLPRDYTRPREPSFAGETMIFEINREQTRQLKQVAKQEETTLFVVLLTIFYVFLAKLSGQEDIIVGTGTAGRNHADLEQIIGMFVNILALRNYPGMNKTFREFLENVKNRTIKAFENQDYPFEELLNHLVLPRYQYGNPLFNAVFSIREEQQNPEPTAQSSKQKTGMKTSPNAFARKTAKFDLTLNGNVIDGKLIMEFEYSTQLYKKERITRYIKYFQETSTAVLENRDTRLKEITLPFDLYDKKIINPLEEFYF